MDAIARTALWTAADRARESQRPDRLFNDPLAELLAGPQGIEILEAAPSEATTNRLMGIRTKFFDDWLTDISRQGTQQIVLLAAGMDARAFRLTWPPGTRLWEVDRPELLGTKRHLLDRSGAQPCCERNEVEADLASETWSDELQRAGFRPDLPSCWLAEGLLVYLEAGDVNLLLRHIAQSASAGSHLGADFVSESFLRSPWMKSYLQFLFEQGAPWRFGTDRPEDVMNESAWRVVTLKQPGEDGVGKGLLPWPVLPRDIPGIPRSYLLTAERAEAG